MIPIVKWRPFEGLNCRHRDGSSCPLASFMINKSINQQGLKECALVCLLWDEKSER